MLKLTTSVLTLTVLLYTSAANAACDYPQEVEIPDGATSSEQDMIAGRDAVQKYLAEMDEYLACLDAEAAAIGEEETPEQKQLHVQRHNSAIDQMETVAAQFNEQLRAYKSKNN